MTSPEGRLRCGRPSAFVPAILPPPINSNFGASPTLFYPLSLRPLFLPPASPPAGPFVVETPRLSSLASYIRFSARFRLFCATLPSAAILHPVSLSICPIVLVSKGYLSSFSPCVFRTTQPRLLLFELSILGSFVIAARELVRHYFTWEMDQMMREISETLYIFL